MHIRALLRARLVVARCAAENLQWNLVYVCVRLCVCVSCVPSHRGLLSRAVGKSARFVAVVVVLLVFDLV